MIASTQLVHPNKKIKKHSAKFSGEEEAYSQKKPNPLIHYIREPFFQLMIRENVLKCHNLDYSIIMYISR